MKHTTDGTGIDRYEPTADVAHQGLRYEAAVFSTRLTAVGHAMKASNDE